MWLKHFFSVFLNFSIIIKAKPRIRTRLRIPEARRKAKERRESGKKSCECERKMKASPLEFRASEAVIDAVPASLTRRHAPSQIRHLHRRNQERNQVLRASTESKQQEQEQREEEEEAPGRQLQWRSAWTAEPLQQQQQPHSSSSVPSPPLSSHLTRQESLAHPLPPVAPTRSGSIPLAPVCPLHSIPLAKLVHRRHAFVLLKFVRILQLRVLEQCVPDKHTSNTGVESTEKVGQATGMLWL